jgi:hypothetical protein
MTDIAKTDIAGFTAAGWKYAASTMADGTVKVSLELQAYGGTHQSHQRIEAIGVGDTLAAATARAITAANNQRGHRYGFGTTVQINDDDLGTVEVLDAS